MEKVPLGNGKAFRRLWEMLGDPLGTGQLGSLQSRPPEVGAIEQDLAQIGPFQIGFLKARIAQVSSAEIRSPELCQPQVAASEKTPTEISVAEVRAAEVGSAQVCPCKAGPLQADFCKLCSSEVHPFQFQSLLHGQPT